MRENGRRHRGDTALRRAIHHPKRLEMLGYIAKEKTGTGEAELADASDLTAGQVGYHLEVLRAAGLVVRVEEPEPGTAGRYVAAAAR